MAGFTDITGRVRHVVWINRDDRFYVFKLQLESGANVMALGVVPAGDLVPGLSVVLRGGWENHPKHGTGFKFTRFGLARDRTAEGLVAMLQSRIDGIGPVMAGKLVRQFGADVCDVLDKTPERLTEMAEFQSAAGQARLQKVLSSWVYNRTAARALAFLMGHGLGPQQAQNAFKALSKAAGFDIIRDLKANPYLLTQVDGIGFILADRVALSIGLKPDDPLRVKAAVYHALVEASGQDGHLYLQRDALYMAVRKLTTEGVAQFGRELLDTEVFAACREMESIAWCRLVLDEDRVYPATRFFFETESAKKLADLLNSLDSLGGPPIPMAQDGTGQRIDEFIERYERQHAIRLSEDQRAGVHLAVRNKVMLLTGLPGTGKTTLMKTVVQLYRENGIDVQPLAPTGIAAKRLTAATGAPAATIHRGLGYQGTAWKWNRQCPLVADAVVVDEASMIDQEVFYRLLDAIRPGTRLVLVGDPAQLPSVGPGSVLQQLIESRAIPHVHLSNIFRQDDASDIVVNAHRINRGEMPVLKDGRGVDFLFVPVSSEEDVLERAVRAAKTFTDKGYNYQVIAPKHGGTVGVTNLNHCIRDTINPLQGQGEVQLGEAKSFREGDRAMIVVNDYDNEVYNGDVGVIHSIDKQSRTITIAVDPERPGDPIHMVEYTYVEARERLKLAFATTVHKCQGLEYDYIILPFTLSAGIMLQRNLLYTAVTRARKKVLIIGEWEAVRRAVSNSRMRRRNTRLGERIRAAMELPSILT